MTAQVHSKMDAKGNVTQLAVDRFIIRPTPGRYGFTVQDTENGEYEFVVLLSGGQDGSTRIGVVFAQCDGGMWVGHSTAPDNQRKGIFPTEEVQKETNAVVRALQTEAGWVEPPPIRARTIMDDVIGAGVRMTTENLWGTPDRERV